MVTKLEGTPKELAEKVRSALSDASLDPNQKAVALLMVGEPSVPSPKLSDQEFEKLMTEAAADTVSVGHMDDSREAMYTRMDGE